MFRFFQIARFDSRDSVRLRILIRIARTETPKFLAKTGNPTVWETPGLPSLNHCERPALLKGAFTTQPEQFCFLFLAVVFRS